MGTLPQERDERWVYVALAVLAVAYVVYRYGTSVDLPDVSFRKLGKLTTALPYLAATFFGVFFQMWGRKKQAAARKRMEEGLVREGALRQAEGVTVHVGLRRKQSFEADIFLTRVALYVFDRARKRDPMRIPTQRASGTAFIEDASLERGASEGPPTVRVQLGGVAGWPLLFSVPDAVAWWMDIRSAIGKSTDVEAELAGRHRDERSAI